MNVLKGSDPRMDFYGADMRLNNIGDAPVLFPVLSPTAAATTPRTGIPYANNEPRWMTFKFWADRFEVEIDGKPAFAGTYVPGPPTRPKIRLQFHGGGKKAGGITEFSAFKVEALEAQPGTAALPPAQNTFPGAPVAKKNILIFVGTAREEALFRTVPGANVRVVKSAETAGVLALPDAIGGANIIVWGRNTFADLVDDALTPAEWDSMLHQMQGGGDVVIFEQSGGNAERTARIKGHWQFIEKNFGVAIHSGPIIGALAGNRDLATRFQAAGISQEILKAFVFGKGFTSLPAGAEVLVNGGPTYDIPVVVEIPVGKGRLILLGASLDRSERDPAFAAALFGFIYGSRGAGEATAPLEGAGPAPAAKPKSGALFDDPDAPPKK